MNPSGTEPPDPIDSSADFVDDGPLDELIHRADLDGLIRLIDARGEHRDWEGVARIARQARNAIRTGRQLWPAATLASYRLALHAPAPLAAQALREQHGPFTIGPLTEVIAQHHRWADLAGELTGDPRATYIAHERVLRGEQIDPETLRAMPSALDVPLQLAPWEPAYALAEYHDGGGRFPTPPDPERPTEEVTTIRDGELLDDGVADAIGHLVEVWTTGSNGRAEIRCVTGDRRHALGALGLRSARVTEISASAGIAWLGWAGASGGAHGRRRGAAAGRDAAWWVLGAMADLDEHWPPDAAELGAFLDELRWWWWDAAEPRSGWRLQLVVEHLPERVAWAILARDDA